MSRNVLLFPGLVSEQGKDPLHAETMLTLSNSWCELGVQGCWLKALVNLVKPLAFTRSRFPCSNAGDMQYNKAVRRRSLLLSLNKRRIKCRLIRFREASLINLLAQLD